MRIHRSRGIFIIGVLLIVVLVAMFVGAAFELSPMGFGRTSNQADLLRAQRAARSGVDYALARLKQDPSWRGGTTRTVTVDQPNLIVVEEAGNVVGLLRGNGETSQFRLRFNFQDGPGGGDLLDDPSDLLFSDLPLVSLNNLSGSGEIPVPKADGSGGAVPASPVVYQVLPGLSVFIASEGRTGNWLNGATSSAPDPTPGFGSVSRSRVEAVYKVTNIGQNVIDSAAASAKDFKVKLHTQADATGSDPGRVDLESAEASVPGRIRSHQQLSLEGGDPTNFNSSLSGIFRVASNTTSYYSNSRNSSGIGFEPEDVANDGFYRIDWDDVKKATPGATNSLPAGVYVVDHNGALKYYEMSLAEYKSQAADGTLPAAQPAILPSTVGFHWDASASGDNPKGTFTISGDTAVTAVGSLTDLAIIPPAGVDVGPGESSGGTSGSDVKDFLATHQVSGGNVDFDSSKFVYRGSAMAALQAYANHMGWSSTTSIGPGGLQIENPTSSVAISDASGAVPAASIRARITTFANNFAGWLATQPSHEAALQAIGLGTSGGASLTPITSSPLPDITSDSNRAQHLAVNFAPASGASAVLSGTGTVTLGTQVRGEGGSIVSTGDIQLVGLGVDLSSSTRPREGVSLYSQRDILISTYDGRDDSYQDVALKGVVYCWGNLKARLGSDHLLDNTTPRPRNTWGKFGLTGSLVAYGKDPSDTSSAPSEGNVLIEARHVGLKFDPSYLAGIMALLPPGAKLGRLWWVQN